MRLNPPFTKSDVKTHLFYTSAVIVAYSHFHTVPPVIKLASAEASEPVSGPSLVFGPSQGPEPVRTCDGLLQHANAKATARDNYTANDRTITALGGLI